MLPFEILAFGVFEAARLRTRYEAVGRASTPLLDELIAVEWDRQVALAEQARPKRLLFNGGLLRYVRHDVQADPAGGGGVFELTVGPTCYRDFSGTTQ